MLCGYKKIFCRRKHQYQPYIVYLTVPVICLAIIIHWLYVSSSDSEMQQESTLIRQQICNLLEKYHSCG